MLILAPTRELAIQINDSIRQYGKYIALKHAVNFGGVTQGPKVKLLNNGFDIISSTLGISRWKDMNQINISGKYAASKFKGLSYWDFNWR